MITTNFKRSACPVANTLDIIGDKWTLLVIRDLYLGKSTYSELQSSIEKIPSNLLAQRLKLLLSEGLIIKQQYHQRPVRYNYRLTEKGRDLGAVLKAMLVWANKHIPGTYTQDEIDAYREEIQQNKIGS